MTDFFFRLLTFFGFWSQPTVENGGVSWGRVVAMAVAVSDM